MKNEKENVAICFNLIRVVKETNNWDELILRVAAANIILDLIME